MDQSDVLVVNHIDQKFVCNSFEESETQKSEKFGLGHKI